jgi:hypothetical protein
LLLVAAAVVAVLATAGVGAAAAVGTAAPRVCVGRGSRGRERGGGVGDCRWVVCACGFAGARVVGRWLCVAIFWGGERLL